jgi:hypothetical protein
MSRKYNRQQRIQTPRQPHPWFPYYKGNITMSGKYCIREILLCQGNIALSVKDCIISYLLLSVKYYFVSEILLYPRFENYNNFWLVKNPGIKTHIPGCYLHVSVPVFKMSDNIKFRRTNSGSFTLNLISNHAE